MEGKKRQTAYKLWISNILSNKYIKQEGWNPNYIKVNGYKVSRVNIVANVISKFEGDNYLSMILDDGSSAIRTKIWGEEIDNFKDIAVGDMVLVIARPKEFNNERYLIPEIMRKLENPNWELLRKAELFKTMGKPELKIKGATQEGDIGEEKKDISGEKSKVLGIIEKHDKGEGVRIDEVIYISGMGEDKVSEIIKELLQWGEIYESKPNYIRII